MNVRIARSTCCPFGIDTKRRFSAPSLQSPHGRPVLEHTASPACAGSVPVEPCTAQGPPAARRRAAQRSPRRWASRTAQLAPPRHQRRLFAPDPPLPTVAPDPLRPRAVPARRPSLHPAASSSAPTERNRFPHHKYMRSLATGEERLGAWSHCLRHAAYRASRPLSRALHPVTGRLLRLTRDVERRSTGRSAGQRRGARQSSRRRAQGAL